MCFFNWFLEMGAHIMSDHLFHAFGNEYRGSFRTNSVWHVGIYIFNDCLVTRWLWISLVNLKVESKDNGSFLWDKSYTWITPFDNYKHIQASLCLTIWRGGLYDYYMWNCEYISLHVFAVWQCVVISMNWLHPRQEFHIQYGDVPEHNKEFLVYHGGKCFICFIANSALDNLRLRWLIWAFQFRNSSR